MLTVKILDAFWRKWEAESKIHVDPRNPEAKAILKKKNKVEGLTHLWLRNLLWSYICQDRVVLAQEQTYRSTE